MASAIDDPCMLKSCARCKCINGVPALLFRIVVASLGHVSGTGWLVHDMSAISVCPRVGVWDLKLSTRMEDPIH